MTLGTDNCGALVGSFSELGKAVLGCSSLVPPVTIAWKVSSPTAVTRVGASPSLTASQSSPLFAQHGHRTCAAGENSRPSSDTVDTCRPAS